jgi:hypothetical protein
MSKEEKYTPAGMQIEETEYELVIRYKWSKIAGVMVLVFSLMWAGIAANFLWGDTLDTYEDAPWFAWVFLTPFVGLGLFFFYLGLAYLLNSTTVTIDFDNIGIKHKPIFWRGNMNIYKYDLKQIYVKQIAHQSKNRTTHTYHVCAIGRGDKEMVLLKTLPDSETAKWIEQKMEYFLKIENKRVKGEYKH